jgi:hypothetical protein
MVQLCHSKDFGSLQLCSLSDIWVLALLFAFSACSRLAWRVKTFARSTLV